MRHCLPDPEAEERNGGYFTVFSCEFDSGKRVRNAETIIRIGEDGKIMFLLCESCLQQLKGQFFHDLALEAMRTKNRFLVRLMIRAMRISKAEKDNKNDVHFDSI